MGRAYCRNVNNNIFDICPVFYTCIVGARWVQDMKIFENGDYTIDINNNTLEYYNDEHIYLVDGVIVPSITEILKIRYGNKYDGVPRERLQKAAERGTRIHAEIERFCRTGEEPSSPEVKNFRFLQKQYNFKVVETEVPVILFLENEPFAAGRLDMVLTMPDYGGVWQIGGADVKTTSALDKAYLADQLNLYRIAYKQSYGVYWKFLRGIWIREDKRKFTDIPINEAATLGLVYEYLEAKND